MNAPNLRQRRMPSAHWVTKKFAYLKARFERLEGRDFLSASALDATFGTSGVALTNVGSGSVGAEALASVLEPNGQALAVGAAADAGDTLDVALLRYNSDGSLDASFGTSGEVVTSIGGGDAVADAVAIQSDGKIVVGGYATVGGTQEMLVARYTANGQLDTTFGGGNGYALAPLGTAAEIKAVAIQSDGKIVAAGYGTGGSTTEFALARFNSDGSLDTSFNSTGAFLSQVGSGADEGTSMALLAGGNILVGGWSANTSNNDLALAEYTSTGAVNTSFGTLGTVVTDVAGNDQIDSLAIQSDGRIVFGGSSEPGGSQHSIVGRYNANGTLDASFGGLGYGFAQLGQQDAVNSVAIAPDGRIVAAGTSYDGKNTEVAVTRYTAAGVLDASFNGTGYLLLSLGTASSSTQAASILADPDGHIMVFGSAETGTHDEPAFAAVRLGTPLTLEGNVLTIDGTDSNDVVYVSFTDQTHFVVGVNGFSQSFTVGTATGDVDQVFFYGGVGSDTIEVTDTHNDDTISMQPGALSLTGPSLSLAAKSAVDYVYGSADDMAQLFGGAGANTLIESSSYASFSGTGYYEQVAGADTVYAYSATGASDTAYVYSVSGGVFAATPTYASLTAGGLTLMADNFATVWATSAGDGTDAAYFYGSAGNDTYVGTSQYAYMQGTGYLNTAWGFASTLALGEGGTDVAYLYGNATSANTFIGTAGSSQLSSSMSTNTAMNFDSVLAVGATTEDTAWLYDDAGDGGFTTEGAYALLSSGNANISVTGITDMMVVNNGASNDDQLLQSASFQTEFFGDWS